MPVGSYFEGHGDEVMASMKKRHGGKKGEQVFYATANAKKMKPKSGKQTLKKNTKRLSK